VTLSATLLLLTIKETNWSSNERVRNDDAPFAKIENSADYKSPVHLCGATDQCGPEHLVFRVSESSLQAYCRTPNTGDRLLWHGLYLHRSTRTQNIRKHIYIKGIWTDSPSAVGESKSSAVYLDRADSVTGMKWHRQAELRTWAWSS
jgi:hypothetical protein